MSERGRLTDTSFIVLALLKAVGEATPYRLKTVAEASVGNFWNLHHAQFYEEPRRLERSGHLSERRETEGRRRIFYEITGKGEEALAAWLAEPPPPERPQLRDRGILHLFFGADPKALAEARLPVHEAALADVESRHEEFVAGAPEGIRRAMEAGIGHEREWVRFWTELRDGT